MKGGVGKRKEKHYVALNLVLFDLEPEVIPLLFP